MIAFLFSPLGKVLVIALGIFSAIAFIDRRATYRERARCEAAKIQSKLDAANKDIEIAQRAKAEAEARARELASEKNLAEEENAKLKKYVDSRPVSEQCILPDRSKWVR